ncbi:hypothetical protein CDAR_48861 [Caerostris darwini]|uniref:Uncharacterized protein n=1 Tax=Caerostris darwini TaxID=1538125 RepID=A0AAV4NJ09_9ARAC|nr:hypothetical protein CDAR_48861 [Caerostris darwini]
MTVYEFHGDGMISTYSIFSHTHAICHRATDFMESRYREGEFHFQPLASDLSQISSQRHRISPTPPVGGSAISLKPKISTPTPTEKGSAGINNGKK